MSGRAIAGFERPASIRLEGLSPLGGQAIFILAATGGRGVLLLPRDSRVVRDQPAEAILEALIGVNFAPGDLQAILTGCVVPDPLATGGRMHANGWASIDLQSGARLYLRRASQWEVRAARRNGWQFEYTIGQSRYPEAVRLVAESQKVQVDLTATLSQLEANVDLPPEAFRVVVSPNTESMTLEELRESGPLRVR